MAHTFFNFFLSFHRFNLFSRMSTKRLVSNNNGSRSKRTSESILNHLFLPHYLPSSADDDYLIQHNHEQEYEILESMSDYLKSIKLTDIGSELPIFQLLTECVERWCHLQNFQNLSVSNIQSTIGKLLPGDFLPLYFHSQNTAILIEIDGNSSNQPLVSAWQVLLPSATITSSMVPHFSCFPVATYRLRDQSELISKVHCQLLMDFTLNTIEYSKAYKCSHEVDETREVPQSHYMCQWWIEQFEGIQIEKSANLFVRFRKKHRDQIRWNKTMLPFRRSGLWMAIKTVLHTILVKRLKDIGTVVYKLFMTHFLTHVISTTRTSTDLLIHCIRKIVRRLNKIEGLLLSINSKEMNTWISCTKQQIEFKISHIIPDPNWQSVIKSDEKQKQDLITNELKLSTGKIYRHSCVELKAYLNSTNFNEISVRVESVNNHDYSTNINQGDYIPSYDMLTKQMKCTIGTALTFMEIWIELCLEHWISRYSPTINGKNRFEILLDFFEEYHSVAINHYYSEKGPTDSIGYSRFILTSLTIIHVCHKKLCLDQRFQRLQLHRIDIPNLMDLFEFLILPNREDMIRAHNLYDYFCEFRQKQYPDLLDNIESENAFGVSYAAQSQSMNDSIQRIRTQAEQDKQNTIKKVNHSKQEYMQLMDIVNKNACEYRDSRHNKQLCCRCKTLKKAKNIKVQVFECPMPLRCESALAVIFELQMPIEIRCYREIIWEFINRTQTQPGNHMYEWLNVSPHDTKLKPYNTGPRNCKVKLVSSTKSVTQSHYSFPPSIGSSSLENFLFENTLQVQISPIQPIKFSDECRILTPQLGQVGYNCLQFTINSTAFLQNHVIAKLSDCPPKIKPTQFVEFGSFRSGHHLQWWNLLTILEMDSLSIAEESVAILIIHSLLQYGPLRSDSRTSSSIWCPESHQVIIRRSFCR